MPHFSGPSRFLVRWGARVSLIARVRPIEACDQRSRGIGAAKMQSLSDKRAMIET